MLGFLGDGYVILRCQQRIITFQRIGNRALQRRGIAVTGGEQGFLGDVDRKFALAEIVERYFCRHTRTARNRFAVRRVGVVAADAGAAGDGRKIIRIVLHIAVAAGDQRQIRRFGIRVIAQRQYHDFFQRVGMFAARDGGATGRFQFAVFAVWRDIFFGIQRIIEPGLRARAECACDEQGRQRQYVQAVRSHPDFLVIAGFMIQKYP